jgi:hypothetical protein
MKNTKVKDSVLSTHTLASLEPVHVFQKLEVYSRLG